MALALIVALPFLGLFLPVLADRLGRSACAAAAAIAPVAALILLFNHQSAVFAGEVLRVKLEWLPHLGLNLSLRLDGLGFLFALLILGIGLLVIL
ncbi:MAG: monovalent cation/H+ antiporter subunit A, partial [Ectopseudomonas oleovorans]